MVLKIHKSIKNPSHIGSISNFNESDIPSQNISKPPKNTSLKNSFENLVQNKLNT